MRARGWYRTTTETVAPGGTPGTVVRFWSSRWTEHVGPLPPTVEHSPDATQVIRIPKTKGMPLMRYRILAALAAVVTLAGVGGFVAINSASAAPENPTLVGKRVLCVTSTGDFKALDAPCSAHLDASKKPMWFAGPLPVPGAAGYAESIRAIAGGGAVDPDVLAALVRAEVAKQVPVDVTPAVKRQIVTTVNVDFDRSKPVVIKGLPAFKAGNPELWGSNAGEITDAGASIVVRRVKSAATTCATPGNILAATALVDVEPLIGSTERAFCVYPFHETAADVSVPGFLAGQKYALTVWVYAP